MARLHDEETLSDPQSVAWNWAHAEHHAGLAQSELQRAIKHLSVDGTDPSTFAEEIANLPQLADTDDDNGDTDSP